MRPLGDDFEAEGITYTVETENPLTTGERFVQWAESTVTSNALDFPTKNAQTRYNLSQFWNLKSLEYQNNPPAWDTLDLRAHQAWASLADLGLVADNPPAMQKYAAEAQEAYSKAQAIAARVNPPMVQTYAHRAGQSAAWNQQAIKYGVDDSLKAAVKDSVSSLINTSFLGVPLWAWVLGAVALVVLVKR